MLQELLLDTDRLLLLPESIFFDYRLEEISFCYYPGNDLSGGGSFVALMERMLPYLDHQDEAGVELAYAVYEQACKGSFGFSLLKDIVHLSYEKEYEKAVDTERQQEEMREEEETEDNAAAEAAVIKHGKVHGWKLLKKKFVKAGGIRAMAEQFWTARHQIPKLKIFDGRAKQEEPFVFEAEEEEILLGRPTVLLSEVNTEPEGILCYEGMGNGKSLKVEGTCLIVGSDAAGIGYIPSATVSRRHARILKEGDAYWLEDLNSVNGTYLNGKALNYKEKVSLQRNCLVQFADEKFRFI
jgi:hypothetical protein